MGGEGGGPAGCRGETNISSSRPLSVTWEGARWSSATGSNGRQLASEALSLTLSLSQSSATTVPAVALTPRETIEGVTVKVLVELSCSLLQRQAVLKALVDLMVTDRLIKFTDIFM